MFVMFGLFQAAIGFVAMQLHEEKDHEGVNLEKVKKQMTLLKRTLVYPPIYMPALFFFLNYARPDLGSAQFQFITDQDGGNGASEFLYAGASLSNFSLGEGPVTCDSIAAVDPSCDGRWLKEMAAVGRQNMVNHKRTDGFTFDITIADTRHSVYLPDDYSFNYVRITSHVASDPPIILLLPFQICGTWLTGACVARRRILWTRHPQTRIRAKPSLTISYACWTTSRTRWTKATNATRSILQS